MIRCITRQMGIQITDDADIARDDRGGTCKMAGGGETRPPSLPAVSWSSHMSPNKCAPFAGVELLPPLGVPTPPSAGPREPWRWRDGGKRGGNILTTLALELRVGAVLVLLKLAHVLVVGCRGVVCRRRRLPSHDLASPLLGATSLA